MLTFRFLSTSLLFGVAPLVAHDMWIEPSAFIVQTGQIVSVRLRVGQDLLGDPIPRNASLIRQFVAADVAGSRPVIGRDGGDPAGYVRAADAGSLVIGYYSNPSSVELDADKFNKYLKDEGLEGIAAIRAKQNASGSRARELFSRCAKTLIESSSASRGQGDRLLGFPLELLAERDPYQLPVGSELPIRLTYQNRPLAGALVVAINRRNPSVKVTARTGSDGRVRLRLEGGGMWLIKAVHMIPAPADSNADWASYWASLTFELQAAAGKAD